MANSEQQPAGAGAVETYVRLFFAGMFVVSFAAVYMVLAVLLIPSRGLRIRLANLYGKIVGPAVVWLVGGRCEFTDRERIDRNAPAIYLFNHTSQLDLFLSIWLCPMGGCGTAKKQLLRYPFFGQAWWLSGHIVIDRSNRERAIRAMNDVSELVAKHRLSIWISPEGTQSRDGRLLRFKKGFAHLALATKLPIVPVVIEGAHHVWPARSWTLRPGGFTVKVLDPIDTSDWERLTLDKHIQDVHQVMHDALNAEQKSTEQA